MEAYMGCMLEECVVRACYLRKHGNREGVNKWLIDWSIDGSIPRRIRILIWKKNLGSEVLQLSVVLPWWKEKPQKNDQEYWNQ